MFKSSFAICLIWEDGSKESFHVQVTGQSHQFMATLMWVARGAMMASNAAYVYVYDDGGRQVLAYSK